jgi:DnaK suppressor protein
MSELSETAVTSIRSELERERDDLRRQVSELGHGEEGRLDYDPNFADSSQVNAERGEAANLASSLQETLADVEHALQKLDDGTYGVCERCSKPISEARLEAMPTTRRCIECANLR